MQTLHLVKTGFALTSRMFLALLLGFLPLSGAQAQVKVKTSLGDESTVYEESAALLIGASNYDGRNWPKLNDIPSELDLVASVLKEQSFRVERLSNPTSDTLYIGIKQFLSKPFARRSRAIVYFSGHGWTDARGVGYLLGVDAPAVGSPEFIAKTLSMEVLRSLSKGSGARHTLVVLDSCYSGSIFTSRGNEQIRPIALEQLQQDAIQFMSSGSATQRVPAASAFTPAFVNGIKGVADLDHDGIVQVAELALFLQREVPRQSQQTPQYGSLSETGGQLIFAPRLTRVIEASTAPALMSSQPPTAFDPRPVAAAVIQDRVHAALDVFKDRFPDTQVHYYRKSADNLGVLNALNRSDIPYVARRAELPDSASTNSISCSPKSDPEAVKAVALALLQGGVPIRGIYTYVNPEVKGKRIQLNTHLGLANERLLSEEDIMAIKSCPKWLTKRVKS